MNEFLYNIKIFLFRKDIFFSLFITIILAVLNILFIKSEQPQNLLIPQMTSFEYFINVQGGASGILYLLLPLSVSIATGGIFIKQKKSSIISYSLTRVNIKTFIKRKLIYIGSASFLFMLICQGFIFIITLLLFPNNNPDAGQGLIIYGKDLLSSNPWVYSFIIILNSCLMAFWFSSFSIVIGIFLNNLYASLMLPYILLMGISQIMMAFPALIGLKGIFIHNMAPLVLAGDYITTQINIFTPIIYAIAMNIAMFFIAVYFFEKRFKKEKIIN